MKTRIIFSLLAAGLISAFGQGTAMRSNSGVGTNSGFYGTTTFNGPVNGLSSLPSFNEMAATNIAAPYVQYHWPLPLLGFDTWSTFSAGLDDTPYTNIVERWVTNLAGTIYSNGIAGMVDAAIYIDDGWVANTRDVNGNLQTRSNVFPSGIQNVIRWCHDKNVKIILYTSWNSLTCSGLPGSPTNYLYKDIQTMMSWGADGCFFDTCDNAPANDKNYLKAAARIANQAVRDYHSLVYSTQGLVRPFYLSTTSGNGSSTPGQQTLSDATLDGFNALAWNWGIQTESLSASVTKSKEVIKYLGPFIRPGFYADSTRVYDFSLGPAGTKKAFQLYAMTAQQLRTGAGDARVGMWTNGVYSGSGAGEGYENFQMTNVFLKTLGNQELVSIWRDPNVRAPTIVRTNTLGEVWHRRLANGDDAILVFNLDASPLNMTISTRDFGGSSNVAYLARAVAWNTNVGYFTNTFPITVAADDAVLLRISKARFADLAVNPEMSMSWQAITISGTGASKATVASQIPAPWNAFDGVNQTAANQFFYFNIPTPWWATQAVIRIKFASAYSGNPVYWQNTVDEYYYHDTGRATVSRPAVNVICSPGNSTWAVHTVPLTRTNHSKDIVITCQASTNASARYAIGSIECKFFGNE